MKIDFFGGVAATGRSVNTVSQGGNVTRDFALWPVTRGCGELTLGTTPRDLGLVTVVVGCGMWPPDCVMLPQYCGQRCS